MGAAPGDLLLGRYELGWLVRVGGTVRVFRGWDRDGGGSVAIKVFPPGSAAATRGGNREGEVLTGIRHVGLVEVLTGIRHVGLVEVRDCGIDRDGCPFVVMDFVEGESLSVRVWRGPLSAEVVVDLGAVLAAALAHVHARGIVHGDVKPGNVLLDEAGRPWLADFGIARFIDATRVTTTGVAHGTAAYMAPEQVRGETVGPAADVYALGLVLLEAVTGRREYEGGGLEAALARLNRIPHVPSDVPDPLGTTLRRMTLTEPTDRTTAAEVATILGEPPAPDELVVGPPRRTLARRLGPVGALAVLATAVVGGAVLLGGGDAGRHTGGGARPEVGPAPAAPAVTGSATVPSAALAPPAPSAAAAPAPTAEARPPGSDPAPPGSSVSSPGPPVRVVAAQTVAEETEGNRAENNGPGAQNAEKGKGEGKANNGNGAENKGKDKGKGKGNGKSNGKSKGNGKG